MLAGVLVPPYLCENQISGGPTRRRPRDCVYSMAMISTRRQTRHCKTRWWTAIAKCLARWMSGRRSAPGAASPTRVRGPTSSSPAPCGRRRRRTPRARRSGRRPTRSARCGWKANSKASPGRRGTRKSPRPAAAAPSWRGPGPARRRPSPGPRRPTRGGGPRASGTAPRRAGPRPRFGPGDTYHLTTPRRRRSRAARPRRRGRAAGARRHAARRGSRAKHSCARPWWLGRRLSLIHI